MRIEILELAAKAAGLKIRAWHKNNGFYQGTGQVDMWGPLDYDDDALRLAVDLDMQITVNRVDGFTEVIAGYLGDVVIRELHGDDMYAATRLAITKAAAEVGRNT